MQIWTYVITHDHGAAPNFDPPATTLAICKPRIRRYAKRGDVVLAFHSAREMPPHSVCWAGVITEVLSFADYWHDQRFQGKKQGCCRHPDNIYEPNGEELRQVRNNSHPPRQAKKDISGKNVLVFQSHWHLSSADELPVHFGLQMIGGRIGERKVPLSEERWRELRQWLEAHTPQSSLQSRLEEQCGCCSNKPHPLTLCGC